MFFLSKKDAFYFLVIWGSILVIVLGYIFDTESVGIKIIYGLFGITVIGIVIWIWFGTGYKIEGTILKVHCRPFKWKINIQEIRTVRKVRSLFTAPALSLIG